MSFAKKSLGQNFLIDKNIIKKIICLSNITNRDVIEIGPGKGALTEEILKVNPKSLSIIEKDNELAKALSFKYANNDKIKIYCSDVLDFDLEKITKKNCIIFGNLPYNISSQILVKIIKFKKWLPNFNDLIFMFQKELGKKILGKYLSKDYGRLSILSNYRLKNVNKFFVSPNCFKPKPKVNSIVIHFQPKKDDAFKIKKIANLEKITNILFSNKRKMIKKNIKKILSDNKIDLLQIKTTARASEIKPQTYYKITELYENN